MIDKVKEFDAVIIGAGFSGLYMLHRLRELGLSVRVIETGNDVGGVWYWNRYPGAKCDIESIYYNYTFSKELYQEWTWTSKYPEQEEILNYLNYVADKFDLRKDIQFETRITAAQYEETNNQWNVELNNGTSLKAKYFISGVGCLSAANVPNFKGLDRFKGNWYHTGNWPKEKVDFSGKRIGVIGNGSSGVQAIPEIAKEAGHLTVFQRTPQYTIPARNYKYSPEFIQKTKDNYEEIRRIMHESPTGNGLQIRNISALSVSPEERTQTYEKAWQEGGFALTSTFNDLFTNEVVNESVGEFIRGKIKEIVKNPETAKKLLPNYLFGTKRPILDTGYYETFNRENVTLVDVKSDPIVEITPNGLRTENEEYELDVLVFATGYDGMTGPLFRIDIRGRDGVSLKEKWEDGAAVRTYLGIATAGFPNFFMITGPESPSVLVNMPSAIEQHVDWIADCIAYLNQNNLDTVESTSEAEEAWSKHCREIAEMTLYVKTDSWYTGANIEGKPRSFLIYLGGFDYYKQKCNEISAKGYEGFVLSNQKALQ
ncbi:flavin-containing monooxygenase [Ureibacillus acetophenoni]|uniref:Catio diffusion facilitator CzcD-associated flavoprotein CzcO n=1 Tax=Ureibacillus acetophenoni TaxID=614649 RepID=A0A285ULM9_9BACL|nr:NAD(P)/FAD-dependent oxidoreductase [Ureibacillus acetophenoni]SOC42722.1 catio diffusion facilitator CzcD-associated flavoprotein CzcO [Ureibacillus acetophenoni]